VTLLQNGRQQMTDDKAVCTLHAACKAGCNRLHLRSLGVAWMGAAMWQGMMRWKSQELAMSSIQSATASGTCRRTANLQRQSSVPRV
jgi:hypothetical protein